MDAGRPPVPARMQYRGRPTLTSASVPAFGPAMEATAGRRFYCYAAPVPEDLSETVLTGCKGHFDKALGEFLLDYDEVRQSENPAQEVLNFLEKTYIASATAAHWDREDLDRHDRVAGRGQACFWLEWGFCTPRSQRRDLGPPDFFAVVHSILDPARPSAKAIA